MVDTQIIQNNLEDLQSKYNKGLIGEDLYQRLMTQIKNLIQKKYRLLTFNDNKHEMDIGAATPDIKSLREIVKRHKDFQPDERYEIVEVVEKQ